MYFFSNIQGEIILIHNNKKNKLKKAIIRQGKVERIILYLVIIIT